MAIKVFIQAETPEDVFNPLTIANALIQHSGLTLNELDAISRHLEIYVATTKQELIFSSKGETR